MPVFVAQGCLYITPLYCFVIAVFIQYHDMNLQLRSLQINKYSNCNRDHPAPTFCEHWTHSGLVTLDGASIPPQTMACCLSAQSHYRSQGWLIMRYILWYRSETYHLFHLGMMLNSRSWRNRQYKPCLLETNTNIISKYFIGAFLLFYYTINLLQ